ALRFFGREGLDRRDHRLKLVELARQCGILRAGSPLGEASGDVLAAAEDEFEIVVGGHCVSSRGGSGRCFKDARVARGALAGGPPAAEAVAARMRPRALWPASPRPRAPP